MGGGKRVIPVHYGAMPENKTKWREVLEALLIAVIFLRFAYSYVAETFYIPSASMEDTLLVGDHLFVNRFIFGSEGPLAGSAWIPSREVRRGDVVIFRSVENPSLDVVKRCIGLPGDRLKMVSRKLYVNGAPLEESAYAVHKKPGEMSARPLNRPAIHRRDNFDEIVVPTGHYFCLGDNRDDSHDSRAWGPLPAHHIKGRALLIYWSYGGGVAASSDLSQKAVHFARTAFGFFTKTRWDRTFLVVR